MSQDDETTFPTQAAQAEADAPPAVMAAQPALVRHGAGLQEPPARPVGTLGGTCQLHLAVVVPRLSQATRGARLGCRKGRQ